MNPREDASLLGAFDAVVCDLDGVVYRGVDAIPGAVEALNAVRRSGGRVAYATNNASRPPSAVAGHLRSMGLELEDADVVTSAQAGARAMLDRVGEGALVLAVGGVGVQTALAETGLTAIRASDLPRGVQVVGVLQGFGSDVAWSDLAEAAYAIQAGALWIATNADSTLPTERGTAPGNGSLIGAVRRAVDVDPVVVGKPEPPLYRLADDLLGAEPGRTLAIGDRLNTDIAGAQAAGMPSLLVLTGVDGPGDLAAAPPCMRPNFIATSLAALHQPYAAPCRKSRGRSVCGSAVVELVQSSSSQHVELELVRAGAPDEQLRAALALLWQAVDDERLSTQQSTRAVSDFCASRLP